MKLIAVPDHALVPEPRLLSGVFMSASLEGEPIVGRLALLHLGFKHNRIITEGDVNPRVIGSEDELAQDLAEASSLGYEKPLPNVATKALEYMNNRAMTSKGLWKITRAIAAIRSTEKQG